MVLDLCVRRYLFCRKVSCKKQEVPCGVLHLSSRRDRKDGDFQSGEKMPTAKWLVSLKEVFNPRAKDDDERRKKKKKPHASKPTKRKRIWICGFIPKSKERGKEKARSSRAHSTPHGAGVKHVVDRNRDQNSLTCGSVALASSAAAEAVVAKAAEEVAAEEVAAEEEEVSDGSKERGAAIKIQMAFRRHRARRALRGFVRLKSLIRSEAVRRQAVDVLRYMQTLGRIQSQIRASRTRMADEIRAQQKQNHFKREQQDVVELKQEKVDEWEDSNQSEDKIKANLLRKHEAAIRRERALAYAFSHQWKSSSRSVKPKFMVMDPNNPRWGWSWIAARPQEIRNTEHDAASSSRSSRHGTGVGEVSRNIMTRRASLPGPKSDSLSALNQASEPATPVVRKARQASPKGKMPAVEDPKRPSSSHSRRSASALDDNESLASSAPTPGYMASTESTRAKCRSKQSPLGSKISPDTSAATVKKRRSFSGSGRHSGTPSGARRLSSSPRPDTSSGKVESRGEEELADLGRLSS